MCDVDGFVFSAGSDVQFPVGFLQCEERPFAPGCDVCQISEYVLAEADFEKCWVGYKSNFIVSILFGLLYSRLHLKILAGITQNLHNAGFFRKAI